MKALFSHLRGALMATLVLAVVCCGIYPLIVFGIAQVFFADKANGSLVKDKDGTIRGSTLLAQGFSDAKYFHPRPSAAGNGWDAANSGGSNLGPTSQKLNDAIKERIAGYREENGLGENDEVPADAVTTSASGLDRHIGVRNAELQIRRVAKARKLRNDQVAEVVRQYTDGRQFGIFGEPGVNVLNLNRALDSIASPSLAMSQRGD